MERSIESCERWALFGGILVFVGVAAEVVIAWAHPPYESKWEQWGSAIADILVGVGVAVELLFSSMAGRRQEELRRRSNIVLGRANEHAANALQMAEHERQARVELELQLGRRLVTRPQYQELQKLRGKVPALALVVSDDHEAKRYAQQLQRTLWHAGIECHISGVSLVGHHGTGGVVYTTNNNAQADVVYEAFRRAGFDFRGQPRGNQYADFIPPHLPVIAVLENPAVTRDWPPESWKGS